MSHLLVVIKLKKPLTVGWHATQETYDNTQTQTELPFPLNFWMNSS